VRFEWTHRFEADFRRLSASERDTFRTIAREFSSAADAFLEARTPWPTRFRVRSVESAPGIFEMTWSFSGPDGRATWEWETLAAPRESHPAVLWRRIGGHSIFKSP
jgi:hypothetical protein